MKYTFGKGESVIGLYNKSEGIGLGHCTHIGNTRDKVNIEEMDQPSTLLEFTSVDSIDFFIEHLLKLREDRISKLKDKKEAEYVYLKSTEIQNTLNEHKLLITQLKQEV